MFAPAGTLRTSVIVLVNDDDIRYRQRGRTPVGPKTGSSSSPPSPGGAPAARRLRRRTAELSSEERHRYSRHLLLPEVGESGQRKLRRARVLLVGAGGLGSPAGLYLAAAGVGTIGIVDSDSVETSNLQRQVLYDVASVGRSKVTRATTRIRELNPHVRVVPHRVRLTSQNALRILRGYDVVVDGTDNFPTRYLVSDACALLGKPDVFGSVYRFEGQVSVFDARRGPCYRCLFPEPPPPELVPSCAEGGVLGVVPGLVGLCQATEVLKLILGIGEPLVGRLWLLDTLAGSSREVRVRKNPRCPVCGRHPTQRVLIDYPAFCGVAGSSERVPEVTPLALARELEREHPPVLVDVREPGEWANRSPPPGETRAERVPCRTSRRPSSAAPDRRLLQVGFTGRRPRSDFSSTTDSSMFAPSPAGLDGWAEQVEPDDAPILNPRGRPGPSVGGVDTGASQAPMALAGANLEMPTDGLYQRTRQRELLSELDGVLRRNEQRIVAGRDGKSGRDRVDRVERVDERAHIRPRHPHPPKKLTGPRSRRFANSTPTDLLEGNGAGAEQATSVQRAVVEHVVRRGVPGEEEEDHADQELGHERVRGERRVDGRVHDQEGEDDVHRDDRDRDRQRRPGPGRENRGSGPSEAPTRDAPHKDFNRPRRR